LSVLYLASLALLTTAILASILVGLRSGDTRIALLGGLFVLLGVLQGMALWRTWGAPLGLDLSTATAAAGFAASALGLLAVVAIGRTLHELDRAETLHWDSMEGVRGLTDLAMRRGVELQDKLPVLLEMGCERLGLDIGLVSRVRGERYEVLALHAPGGFPISAGSVFPLDETHCRNTLTSDRPVALHRAADARWAEHPNRTAFRFEAYLATAIRVGEELFGTLVFASLKPRRERFTATHKDLLRLMAQWIGSEFELRQFASQRERRQPGTRSARPLPVRHHTPPAPAGLRLNELLERLERRIRRAVPPGVDVAIEPCAELATARELRIPLEALILSLVRRAAEALPDGGRLCIATANHEPIAQKPGVLPAVVPDRYVTLSVSESNGALEADAVARIFDADARSANEPATLEATQNGGLPLSTVYRMLQRVGGDLSVEIEPGRGSTFTVFLPLATRTTPTAPSRGTEPRPTSTPVAH
jgi:signal transduction histidine kinase